MSAYYNEIEPYAAEWLRNLIKAGHIADGEVDTRSIVDVRPSDLVGFTQCHFFAGIGVWSHSLRLAGWPDDRPVWTGSCPCQPFSAAGKGAGFDDARHLWPVWHGLIRECGPPVVFGEQVASKDGLGWLDLVHADMEAADYAIGAFDLCAAGVGAPHIRQRLYFAAERMADADDTRLERRRSAECNEQRQDRQIDPCCVLVGLADAGSWQCEREQNERPPELFNAAYAASSTRDGFGACGSGLCQRPSPTNGFWGPADWLGCRDGKFRPVEPGTFPLVNGAPGRVGRLRAYGNAICAPLAKEVIAAFMECRP